MKRSVEPKWLSVELVLALHDRLIVEFGGRPGLRDRAMLESALERPRNLWLYRRADHFDLAAAYAFGLARNHPFVDGNKRVGWMSAAVFLETNGYLCRAREAQVVLQTLGLAAGEVAEKRYAAWLRSVCVRAGNGKE
jgi:death on curing protein